jgi:hypothetical protein
MPDAMTTVSIVFQCVRATSAEVSNIAFSWGSSTFSMSARR